MSEVSDTTHLGVHLSNNLYKKRVKNSSIPTVKNGGFGIIIYQKIENIIILISIYSKTDKESLSDEEFQHILKSYIKSLSPNKTV